MEINEYSPDRAARLKTWGRNRDVTDGIDAVKAKAETYLPKRSTMEQADYARLLLATEFHPAAARTLQSFIGLVFRKLPNLDAPDALTALKPILTADGTSLESLSRWAFREYAITNDGGILIDHPDVNEPLTRGQAEALDLRPYAASYRAEAILGVEHRVQGGRKHLSRVRLQDDAETIRELLMDEGRYTVRIWTKADEKTWTVASEKVPLSNGKPLTAIPFIHLAGEDTGSAMDDLCSENIVHLQHSFGLALALAWVSSPVMLVTGVEGLTDDDGKAKLTVAAGAVWAFEAEGAKASFIEIKGDQIPAIERKLDRLETHMAMLGSRMLASEKAAAEAAETVARRQASENSILASMARHIAAKIEAVVKLMGAWMGLNRDDITLTFSTEFLPESVDPQILAHLISMNQSGSLPPLAFFESLQKYGLIGEDWDYESYMAAIDTAPST